MPLSPKTTQFTQEQGPEDQDATFKQLLEESARTKLLAAIPDLEQRLVTFKVLEADADKGNAVAAYIVDLGHYEGYIPIVMSEGDIRTPSSVYDPRSKLFLPLTKEWISEIQRGDLQDMGEATKVDPSAAGDLDITSLVRPPYSGRFVYASASKKLRLIPALKALPVSEKVAFTNALKQSGALLKMASTIYGAATLVDALQDNTNAPPPPTVKEAEFVFATRDTSPKQLKESFGRASSDAMRVVAKLGYAVMDKRASLNGLVDGDTTVRLHSITRSGVYELYLRDGSAQRALVIVEPFAYEAADDDNGNPYYNPDDTVQIRRWTRHENTLTVHRDQRSLVIQPNGKTTIVYGSTLLAKTPDSLEPDRKDFPGLSEKPRLPRPGEMGVWIKRDKDTVHGTDTVLVKGVRDDGDRKIVTSASHMFVITPDAFSLRNISDDTTLIPNTYAFMPVEIVFENYAEDPLRVSKFLRKRLKTAGCYELKAWKGTYGYVTNIDRQEQSAPLTAIKIAGICNLSVKEAENVIGAVNARGKFTGYVLTPNIKLAAPPPWAQGGQQQPPPGQDPNAMAPQVGPDGQPVDPNAMAPQVGPDGQPVDPNAVAPQVGPDGQPVDPNAVAPPPPSPEQEALVTALQDVHGTISAAHDQEMAAMQERAKSLEMQSAALETVSSRMQEVLQGVPQEESSALANLGAASAQISAQEAPTAGAQPQQGPAGQAQPQQGPADGAAMEEAGGVPDPSVFDTAALAQLGRSSSVGSVFAEYIPSLTAGLDHLNRILLTLEMNRSELSDRVSHAELDSLEDKLRGVVKDSADLLLVMTKKVSTLSNM